MDPTSTKTAISSLTINSAAVACLLQVLAAFGVQLDVEVVNGFAANVSAIVTAGLALVAIYGRVRATHLIKPASPTSS